MEFIIIITVFWLFTTIVLNFSEHNQIVIVENRFNKKIFLINDSIGFKLPYPFQKVIGSIVMERTIKRYIELNGIGFDFELSYAVKDPIKAYYFVDNLDDYLFEFIYNTYDNNDFTNISDKLSIVFERKGLFLNSINVV